MLIATSAQFSCESTDMTSKGSMPVTFHVAYSSIFFILFNNALSSESMRVYLSFTQTKCLTQDEVYSHNVTKKAA